MISQVRVRHLPLECSQVFKSLLQRYYLTDGLDSAKKDENQLSRAVTIADSIAEVDLKADVDCDSIGVGV